MGGTVEARKRLNSPKSVDDPLDGLFTVSRPELLVKGSDLAFRQFVSTFFAAADIVWRARGRLSRKFGMTANQFAILLAVRHFQSGTSIRRLADHLKMAAANVTKEVNSLVTKRLLKKNADPKDSRALSITLAPKGYRLLMALLPISQEINDIQYERMSTDEMYAISAACARVVESEGAILRMIARLHDWK